MILPSPPVSETAIVDEPFALPDAAVAWLSPPPHPAITRPTSATAAAARRREREFRRVMWGSLGNDCAFPLVYVARAPGGSSGECETGHSAGVGRAPANCSMWPRTSHGAPAGLPSPGSPPSSQAGTTR